MNWDMLIIDVGYLGLRVIFEGAFLFHTIPRASMGLVYIYLILADLLMVNVGKCT